MTTTPLTDRSTPIVAIRTTVLLAGVFAEAWNLVTVAGEGERLSEHLGYFTVQSNLLVPPCDRCASAAASPPG